MAAYINGKKVFTVGSQPVNIDKLLNGEEKFKVLSFIDKYGILILRDNKGNFSAAIQVSVVDGVDDEQVCNLTSNGDIGHIWAHKYLGDDGKEYKLDPKVKVDWTKLIPSMHIKNNKVAINKLVADKDALKYELDVNGSINGKEIFINGVKTNVLTNVEKTALATLINKIDILANTTLAYTLEEAAAVAILIEKLNILNNTTASFTQEEKEKLLDYPKYQELPKELGLNSITSITTTTGPRIELNLNERSESRISFVNNLYLIKNGTFGLNSYMEKTIIFKTLGETINIHFEGFDENENIHFTGDDTLEGQFIPVAKTLYEIFIYWNGFNFQGIVRGVANE